MQDVIKRNKAKQGRAKHIQMSWRRVIVCGHFSGVVDVLRNMRL